MKITKYLALLIFVPNLCLAQDSSAEFDQIQKVLGKWEGTLVRSAQEDIPITLEYTLISNGTAIVERSIEDGVEMMTAFVDNGDQLLATHYCGLGNQPKLNATAATDNSVFFKTDTEKSGLKKSNDQFVDTWSFENLETGGNEFTYTYTVSNPDNTVETNSANMKRVL